MTSKSRVAAVVGLTLSLAALGGCDTSRDDRWNDPSARERDRIERDRDAVGHDGFNANPSGGVSGGVDGGPAPRFEGDPTAQPGGLDGAVPDNPPPPAAD